jgi:23S rRNA pseudouridine955/2504/2580 synthase
MIAKDKKTLEALLALLQSGHIQKIYHAIVIGKPPKSRDTIREKLLRIEDARDEAKVRIDPLGQEAITHYQVLRGNIA